MADQKPKPDALSGDAAAMAEHWKLVADLMTGADAMRTETYLPRFPKEAAERYEFRRKTSKFTNIFRDIVENLAARPFGEEVTLADDASERMQAFATDVDGFGNSLHVFAGEVFFKAIASGIDWILADYPNNVAPNATVAEERLIGARPYWVGYPATAVLAAYSEVIDGEEQFIHVRLREDYTQRVGFKERSIQRVRVLERAETAPGVYAPPTYTVWEYDTEAEEAEWVVVEEGTITLPIIPLVPVVTGRRIGASWQLHPPMKDAAELQREHFQQESALKYARTMTAFPILTGNGVSPELDAAGKPVPVAIGPHTVLYAPQSANGGSSSWQFIEPSGESLRFLADDIKATATELRELGRQPLTTQSGNLTVITTAFAAAKGNTAIQAWALGLKVALERALKFTAMWLREPSAPAVIINTDFDLSYGDDDGFGNVMELRKTGDISREAAIHEAKRRNILDKEYDPDADLEALLKEIEDEPDGEAGDSQQDNGPPSDDGGSAPVDAGTQEQTQ